MPTHEAAYLRLSLLQGCELYSETPIIRPPTHWDFFLTSVRYQVLNGGWNNNFSLWIQWTL